MEWYIILAILVISLTLLLFMGLPVAFSLGFLSIICAFIFWPGMSGIYGVALAGYSHMSNYTLVCVPLFILMSEIVMFSRMGTDTYEVADRFLRGLPGGLGITSTVFGAIFGAVCGASTAGTATVGLLSLPEMIRRGYNKGFAGAIVGFAGALSILIPPSVILILYGTLANESIGGLFIGGLIPGVIMTILASLFIIIRVKMNPSIAPRDEVHFTWKEKISSIWKVWGLFIVILLLLGTIYTGVATPTEASAVGCLAVFVIALAAAEAAVGLALFIKSHDDNRSAVFEAKPRLMDEIFFTLLKRNGVNDAFALYTLQASFNDLPLGRIDHNRYARNIRF